MKNKVENTIDSVRQRLINLSKERGEDPNLIFIRYAIERFLYHLSCSNQSGKFILKSAMLWAVWANKSHRPMKDLDLLGFGNASADVLRVIFQQICNVTVEPDGMTFNPESIQINEIREDLKYPGQRIKLESRLGNACINIQINIDFGDSIIPAPIEIDYPTLMDMPSPHIKAYPLETVVAEKLETIVSKGMLNSQMKDFYGRFFPNQDTLLQGGPGNLIALPLQKKPGEKGNTEFLDENFITYADQWQYLSTIEKIGRDVIEALFQKACDNGRIIGLRLPATQEDDEPWETPPSGKKNQIIGPFPQEVNVVLANQIFIPKTDLSPSLRNALIRFSAFQNPEFYQKQAMRMPTYNIPRIICCAEDFDKYIALPRGCFDEMKELFKKLEIKVIISDKQLNGKPIDIAFSGTLYPEQKTAATVLLEHGNGILAAATAFGKTVFAC